MRIFFLRLFCITLVTLTLYGCREPMFPLLDQRADRPSQDLQPPQDHQRLKDMLIRLPAVKTVVHWHLPEFIQDRSVVGLTITTRHYKIYTTLSDPLILRKIPVFLDSAFRDYAAILGKTTKPDYKFQVYFFRNRSQWEDFTRYWTGPHAVHFLKIKSGAYYFNRACVAYNLTRKANFSVLAHEGWHQFSNELFEFYLPAWLDEGLATNFEAFRWENGRVIFDSRYNASRLYALRQTIAGDNLFSLSDLLTLDAGHVIARSSRYEPDNTHSAPEVAAYYSQLYALVRFLREYNYGQYYRNIQQMLEDACLGRWPLDAQHKAEALQRLRNPTRRWNAVVGLSIFQSYITQDMLTLELQYRNFCRQILKNTRFKKER